MNSNPLETRFAGLVFQNPVVLASGTAGFGVELAKTFNITRLGGVCMKGLTLNPCPGNTGVRVWECAAGLLNSIGLENPGVASFVENTLPEARAVLSAKESNCRLIVNLGGHSLAEYTGGAEILAEAYKNLGFDMLELNISCPNLGDGGRSFGVKARDAAAVVRGVRSVFPGPLCVKLSPNAEKIVEMAIACEEAGADALSLVNTFLGLAVDIERRKAVFDNVYAGLSGPGVKPIALRMVREVSRAVKAPVSGGGGIMSAACALEFIMAGASLVQVGTANFVKPDTAIDIIDGMTGFLEAHGIVSLAEIRGVV